MKSFNHINVLCVGDIMLDTFTYGGIERISPEAPVPVFKRQHAQSILGGAGNVVRNLVSLGAHVMFAGAVGQDETAETIYQAMHELGQVTPLLMAEKNRKTPHKERFVAQGQQILRVDDENTLPIQESTRGALLEAIGKHISQAQIVVLSDYAKGTLVPALVRAIIQMAHDQHIPVIIDPKGQDYGIYEGATLLTPNLKEFQLATGQNCQTTEEIIVAAQKLRAQLNIDYLLVTRSQEGMTLIGDQETHHIPANAREVYDVSGAGDTVVAVLAAALASGLSMGESAGLANQAAGIVVGKAGTAVITPNELSRGSTLADKNLTRETLKSQIAQWRRQGLKIGFTNGCFDLLHLGHLHILKQARAACDKLIVGLNSDASVKALKGEDRPIQHELTRAQVLAALETVDGVMLFDESTPITLIETILPDVLIKGADYRLDQVVGADIVMRNGGRVVLAELLPGNSTTATVERLKSVA